MEDARLLVVHVTVLLVFLAFTTSAGVVISRLYEPAPFHRVAAYDGVFDCATGAPIGRIEAGAVFCLKEDFCIGEAPATRAAFDRLVAATAARLATDRDRDFIGDGVTVVEVDGQIVHRVAWPALGRAGCYEGKLWRVRLPADAPAGRAAVSYDVGHYANPAAAFFDYQAPVPAFGPMFFEIVRP